MPEAPSTEWTDVQELADHPQPDPLHALAEAINANDTARVKALLAADPKLRSHLDDALPGEPFGATALLRAVQAGNAELIDVLLGAGADINGKSHWWAGGFSA